MHTNKWGDLSSCGKRLREELRSFVYDMRHTQQQHNNEISKNKKSFEKEKPEKKNLNNET